MTIHERDTGGQSPRCPYRAQPYETVVSWAVVRRTADYFPSALQADRAQRLGHKTMISCDKQVIRKSDFSRNIRRRSGVLKLHPKQNGRAKQ